jgi:class 3 adenylate cyclase
VMESSLCPVLIGREHELSTLEDALLAAKRGEAQVVVLAGDAGMGKTRLATELQRRARRLRMATMWGGCSDAEPALPYLPFLEGIGNYLQSMDLVDLGNRLGPVRRELGHLFPQLESEPGTLDIDTTEGRLRLYEAIVALLNLAAQEQGLLLVIEDLHWADASTRELLDYLSRRFRNGRVMVLATHRSDELHRRHPLLPLIQGWRRSSTATIVELAPLTAHKVAEMVSAIFDLGLDGVQDDTRDFLFSRTEGNPFVLEEMLKAALDRGDIFRNDLGWTRKALTEFSLPTSVRDTILLRVDRLSADQVEVLRTAAVLGSRFSYAVLLAMCGRPEAAVRAAVEAAIMQQLLADDQRQPRGYRFRHALTREAIYDDIIAPVRESLHGLAADALISGGGTPIEVSQHLLAAGRTADALPLCLEAAAQAEIEYAHADAAALYERVLPHVIADHERAVILCRLGTAYQGAGAISTGHDFLQSGIAMLDQLGRSQEAAHYLVVLGRCKWERGRLDEALAVLERARSELEPAGPSADLALTYVRLGLLRIVSLDMDGAAELARRACLIAEKAGADDVLVQAQINLGDCLVFTGHLDEGLAIFDSNFDAAIARGRYSIARIAFDDACMCLVWNLRAGEVLERLAEPDVIPESVGKSPVRTMFEGWAAYRLGDLPRAAQAFEAVEKLARTTNSDIWLIRSRLALAECLFDLGQEAEARSTLPPREAFADTGDLLQWDVCVMRHLLAGGENAAAAAAGSFIFDPRITATPAVFRSYLASWSTWSFISAQQTDLANKAVQIGLGDGTALLPPFKSSLEAGLAFLANDEDGAIRHLREALEAFDAAGYNADACPLRRRLAGLLVLRDDSEGARTELQQVFDVASRLGMVVEKRIAAEALRELGVSVELGPAEAKPATGARGERYVTVLFVDVRGYTAMARGQSPPDLTDTMATLHRWAGAEVEKHQGIVDKFAGDAVMATFNVSGAHIDHAEHALSCAIVIRDKAGAMGLQLGAGIATGPAVVGSLTERANVSVVGETTNLASRLQGLAKAGEILLAPETYRRVQESLSTRGYQAEVEELELKGFDQPVTAYRVPGNVPTIST